MNPEEFMKYLADHGGEAWVKNPETLDVAKKMEEASLLTEIGTKDGAPMYRLTPKGTEFIGYSLKRLPGDKTRAAKKALKTLLNGFQDYAQAFKAEHPVGMEDIRRTASVFRPDEKSNTDFLRRLQTHGLERRQPDRPRLEKPKKREKDSEYIVVNGKRYKKVD